MTPLPRAVVGAALSAAAFLILTGCGGGGEVNDGKERTLVKGRLVKDGSPFFLDESSIPLPKGATALPPGITASSMLEIRFISADSKTSYVAQTNPQAGTFEIPGDNGKGIPVGRYKIVVTARLGISPDTPDMFKGHYTQDKTKIVRDIKAGEEVTIDVAKPQG